MGSTRAPLIIGVGNRFRGDDGIGPALADRLRAEPLESCDIVDSSGEAAELMELWEGHDLVVIVDAVKSDMLPGTIHAVDVGDDHLPLEAFQASTHTFGLAQAVELARALGRLPQRLIIYGVEGSDFAPGQAMSDAVSGTAEIVADRIRNLVLATTEARRHDA